MSSAVRSTMTVADFLAWEERQETRHEFVGGTIRAMTGGTLRHNQISLNVVVALRSRLRGGPCAPFGIDVKVRTPAGNIRYPDALVDCGKRDPTAQEAAEPRVVFEVLSPSTEWFDQTQKLEDYQSIASVTHVVFLAQDRKLARIWTRGATGWAMAELAGDDAAVELTALQITLPFAELYEGAE
jgi:Uma2 family endonuclease